MTQSWCRRCNKSLVGASGKTSAFLIKGADKAGAYSPPTSLPMSSCLECEYDIWSCGSYTAVVMERPIKLSSQGS